MRGLRRLSCLLVCALVVCALLVCSGARRATAQAAVDGGGTAAPAEVVFERDWPEQSMPFYRILVRADGSGLFSTDRSAPGMRVSPAATPAQDRSSPVAQDAETAGADESAAAQHMRVLQITEKTRARLFAVEGVMRSPKGCETGTKHLAQTGTKVLTLRANGAVLTCTFNFSDDKHVQDAVTAFSGIATTMEEQGTLEHLLRFDRLGLDAELGSFLESAHAGRAIELENIAPLLRKLAGDEVLMDRVRSRAATLLSMAEAGS